MDIRNQDTGVETPIFRSITGGQERGASQLARVQFLFMLWSGNTELHTQSMRAGFLCMFSLHGETGQQQPTNPNATPPRACLLPASGRKPLARESKRETTETHPQLKPQPPTRNKA